MEFYKSLNALQRFQYHCEIEKLYIEMSTDIQYIDSVMKSYRIEIINPYDLNPTEKMKLRMIGSLCQIGMKRIGELLATEKYIF